MVPATSVADGIVTNCTHRTGRIQVVQLGPGAKLLAAIVALAMLGAAVAGAIFAIVTAS